MYVSNRAGHSNALFLRRYSGSAFWGLGTVATIMLSHENTDSVEDLTHLAVFVIPFSTVFTYLCSDARIASVVATIQVSALVLAHTVKREPAVEGGGRQRQGDHFKVSQAGRM
jgi:hypothetical protein